jgi:GWxTD domain-containing protein
MKKLLLLLILGGMLPLIGGAQSRNVNFFLDICRFQDISDGKAIAEIYFAIDGTSIQHKKDADSLKFQCSVNISWLLEKEIQGEGVDTIAGSNITLSWAPDLRPEDTTLESLRQSLFYMQKIDLQPGKYRLQAIARDNYTEYESRTMAVNEFIVEAQGETDFKFSDIKWIAEENLKKARREGRTPTRDDLIPLVTNDAFINADSMAFYQEIYHSDQLLSDKTFTLIATIWQGGNRIWAYELPQAKTTGRFRVFKGQFDISKLKSNTYYLQIDLVNNRNQPLQTYRKKFYVYNSRLEIEFDRLAANVAEGDLFGEYEAEELDYYLATLGPISTEQERNFVKVLNTLDQKRNYLYSFFDKRRRNPSQKVVALWNGHLAALDYINQQFKSSFKAGWQTDRGRAFLQYGIPNDVERYPHESGLMPYEIWRYNRLGSQTNVIFIFYDPDLATNEYPLLHSTKYGEISNPRWRAQLDARNGGRNSGQIDYENDFDPATRFPDSKLNVQERRN